MRKLKITLCFLIIQICFLICGSFSPNYNNNLLYFKKVKLNHIKTSYSNKILFSQNPLNNNGGIDEENEIIKNLNSLMSSQLDHSNSKSNDLIVDDLEVDFNKLLKELSSSSGMLSQGDNAFLGPISKVSKVLSVYYNIKSFFINLYNSIVNFILKFLPFGRKKVAQSKHGFEDINDCNGLMDFSNFPSIPLKINTNSKLKKKLERQENKILFGKKYVEELLSKLSNPNNNSNFNNSSLFTSSSPSGHSVVQKIVYFLNQAPLLSSSNQTIYSDPFTNSSIVYVPSYPYAVSNHTR